MTDNMVVDGWKDALVDDGDNAETIQAVEEASRRAGFRLVKKDGQFAELRDGVLSPMDAEMAEQAGKIIEHFYVEVANEQYAASHANRSNWLHIADFESVVYLYDIQQKALRCFNKSPMLEYEFTLTDEQIAELGLVSMMEFTWPLAEQALADHELRGQMASTATYDGLLDLARSQGEGTLMADEMAMELAKKHGRGVVLEWGATYYVIGEEAVPFDLRPLEIIHLRLEALNQALLTLTRTQGVNAINAHIFTGHKRFITLMYWREEDGWYWGDWSILHAN